MKTHAIIEIEEGSLTLTVASKAGESARVLSCERFPLAETSHDAVANVLRGLGRQPLHGGDGVHVIIGDRRAAHFVTNVPKMPVAEVVDFVVREALRVSSLPSQSDIMVAPRLLRQLPGGKLAVAASALPKVVYKPIRAAFESAGISVLGLHTSESCLALAAPQGAEDHAVLELSGGRARFVLCDDDAPVQVRRFILGGVAEGGPMAIAAQLAIELPRTYDWLREAGHAQPRTMLLGNRLGLDEDSVDMLRGDLEDVRTAPFSVEVPEDGETAPGLATLMLLSRLFADRPLPSLLADAEIRVPWSRARITAIAAAAVVGIALSVHAVADARGYLALTDQASRVAADCERLEQQAFAAEAAAMPAGEAAQRDPQLDLALSMRRPISRMIAEVSNAATERVHIESMQFSSTEEVALYGVVKGRSRQEALAVLAQFVARLRELPYFESDGKDEVNEVPGAPDCLRFRLAIAWRNP